MSYYYYNTVLPLLLTTGSPGQGADSLHRDHRPGQHQGQGGHCQVIQQGEQWAPGRLFGYSIINFFRYYFYFEVNNIVLSSSVADPPDLYQKLGSVGIRIKLYGSGSNRNH